MASKRSWGLYCGVALCALLVPGVALASGFTIVSGQTVYVTQTLNTAGDVGTVEQGGSILPNGAYLVFGIIATDDNVTINNAGTVHPTSTGISVGISIKNNSIVNNSGVVDGEFGIEVYNGNFNTIINSGTIYGVVYAVGSYNTIINSGTVERFGSAAIFTTYNATITNTGTVAARNSGPGVYVFDSNVITNSGTIQGFHSGIEAYSNNTIINSGKLVGGNSAVFFQNTNNTLNLLAGSNIQGNLALGAGNFLNIGPGLNTAFAYTGTPTISMIEGQPFVDTGSLLAVVDTTGFSAQDEMLTDLTRAIANTVDGRLASSRMEGTPVAMAMNGMIIAPTADVPAGPNAVIWAAGLGTYRNQSGDGADVGFDSTLGGLTVGLDGEVADGIRAGGFIGAALSNFETDGGSQEIDTDSYFGGLYAGFTGSGHFLDLSLTGGYADQSSDRTVANNQVVPGGIDHAKADYGGFFISPSATLGTDIRMNDGILTPSVRGRYASMFFDGYTESGSLADLSVDSRNVNVIDLRGQLAFAPTAMTTDGGTFSTTFRVGADATFANGDEVDAVLLGQSLSFNVSNDETTVRGFAGLDMAYVTDGGSRFFLGAEAGYDTSDAFTGEAKAGFEIPL